MSEAKQAAGRTARRPRANTEARNAKTRDASPSPAAPTVAKPAEETNAASADTVQRFAERSLRQALAAFATHTPAAGTLPDATAVHQLRIAARRMRVWARMFRSLLPAEHARHLSQELRRVARALGTVRDLDVYTAHLPSYVAEAGISLEDLGGYERDLERTLAEARAALAGVYADPRFAALGEELARTAALLAADVQEGPGAEPLTALARRRLRRTIKKVRKRGAGVAGDAPADALHELRIETKKLRYELEFFATVHPELAATARTVKRMQDLLGELQDAAVASENLERYALGAGRPNDGPLDTRRAFALGRLMQAQVERATDVRRRFSAAWREFDKELKRARKTLAVLE